MVAATGERAETGQERSRLRNGPAPGKERTETVEKVCVFNKTRQSFLSLSATVADTYLSRLKGLLGRRKLKSDEGLWVVPSQGIHTIGMLFPIDVVFLDEEFRVIHIIEDLGPFRVSALRRGCASVLELPTRTIYTSQTQVGDELLICPAAEMELHWRAQQARKTLQGVGVAMTGGKIACGLMGG